MPLIIRIACAASILLALPAQAADLRSQVSQYRLAHEADIVGEIDALTRLKSIAADPAGLYRHRASAEAALEIARLRGVLAVHRREFAARSIRITNDAQGQTHRAVLRPL